MLKDKIDINSNFFRFYVRSDVYIEFELSIPIKDIKHLVYSEGYYYKQKQKSKICYYSYLKNTLHEFKLDLLAVQMNKNRIIIKPDLFESGIGWYKNNVNFHTPEEMDSNEWKVFTQKFPDPSLENTLLSLWQGCSSDDEHHVDSKNSWLYNHQSKTYLEVASIYEWDECDEADYVNYAKFMESYEFDRYEISPEQIQIWLDDIDEMNGYLVVMSS